MKPCRENRKQIAWLAAAVLADGEARVLRAHLETCEGCCGYFAEISSVTESLAAADVNPETQTSKHFHQKVVGKLRAARPESAGESLFAHFREICTNWRLVLPVAAALVLACALAVTWWQPAKVALLPQAGTKTVPELNAKKDLAPTIANYQRVVNESPDKLDDLLTRQGFEKLPPAPVYTASTVLAANLPE